MLRYLSPGRSVSHTPAGSSRDRDERPVLTLHVPNSGIIIIPAPEAPAPDGRVSDEPREDYMLHGELEVRIGGNRPRRCKALRVGFRTIIKLDLGSGRRSEEDVLFERKLEIVGADSEGVDLQPGSQRFDFTLILPANLAPHDWHPNGTIQHWIYAELEGTPEERIPRVGSSASLFSFRSGSRARSRGPSGATGSSSRANSRPGSRAPSPSRGRVGRDGREVRGRDGRPHSIAVAATAPVSGTATPQLGGSSLAAPPQALAGALASLNLNPNGTVPLPASEPGSRRSPGHSNNPSVSFTLPPSPNPNPAHLSAAASMSLSRPETPLPRIPSYENAMALGSGASTPPEWVSGTTRVDRKLMLIYNPDPTGGASGFDDQTDGFIKGLGVWSLNMISDIWSISALLAVKVKLSSIPAATTVFSMRLLLSQTTSIISPRDPDDTPNKIENTRNFTVVEAGKRPPPGHHHPDRHYPALWRGTDVPGGKDQAAPGRDGGEIIMDTKGRLPTDDVGRPSTLPGVVTPISVSHHLIMEVYFSVWSEDDRGERMKIPGPGGLRMLRVSRPVTIPSCNLMPQILDLPRYGDHEKDPVAPDTPNVLPEDNKGFGWAYCACGMKADELDARMKAAAVSEAAASGNSLAGILAAAQADDKAYADRDRGRRTDRHGSI